MVVCSADYSLLAESPTSTAPGSPEGNQPSATATSPAGPRGEQPTLQELSPAMRDFARELTGRLFEQQAARGVRFAADTIFGPSPSRAGLPAARAA